MERCIHQDFSSDLMALGRSTLGPDSAEWRAVCTTGEATVLGFPRRSFAVRPSLASVEPAVLHPGTVSLPHPGREFERHLIDPAGEEGDWLWLREDLLDSLVGAWRQAAWGGRARWCRTLSPDRLFQQRQLHLAARGERGADPARLESAVIEFVRGLNLGHGGQRESRGGASRRRRIAEVIEWLAADLERPARLTDCAKLAGWTPSHFCVVFRQETGQTLGQYLTDLRLCCALDRLRERGGDLTELALVLGFCSHSHFGTRFKSAFGCTPVQARRVLSEAHSSCRPPTESGESNAVGRD